VERNPSSKLLPAMIAAVFAAVLGLALLKFMGDEPSGIVIRISLGLIGAGGVIFVGVLIAAVVRSLRGPRS